MGTILSRPRKDGTMGHTALIRIKKAGKVIHSETETFDRKQAAEAWLKKRETELAKPGALDKVDDPTLTAVIQQYNLEKIKQHGKTKTQVLRTIEASELATLRCSQIASRHIVEFAQSLKVTPQTVGNYISHLASIFTVARPAWGYPLDPQAMADARVVLSKLGIVSRSNQRTRRPTLDELDRLMRHFEVIQAKRSDTTPMTLLIPFAIFSTRRQEEICRVLEEDLDHTNQELLVRDMKNPGEKLGNDVRTTLTPEALKIITVQLASQRTPSKAVAKAKLAEGRIWPYNAESVSTAFTRACKFLDIEDLHFHDLRHEGISRLFEMGWNIPHVAMVSGHRTWTSLKRYTHIRQTGDKYSNWSWLSKILGPSKPHDTSV